MMFFFFLLTFALILSCYHYKRWDMYKYTREIPGPRSYPIIGSSHLFFNKSCEQVFDQIQKLLKKFHSPAKIWFGPVLAMLIDDPDDLQVVLNSDDCLEKSYVYKFFGCDEGLFAASADIWKVHRKMLNNCFSFSVLQKYFSIMNEKSKIFAEVLEQELGGGEFDVLEYSGRCTLDMTFATNFQLDVDVQRNYWGMKFLKALEKLAEAISERIFCLVHHPTFIFKRTGWGKQEHESRTIFNEAAQRVIKNCYFHSQPMSKISEPMPFINKLLHLREFNPKIFTEQAIKDEIDTLVVGGNETTGLTIAFTLLMLAMHPDIQERVYQEILSTCDTNHEPTYNTLQRLTYIEMVIKETLRHFAVGPVIGRKATANVKLKKYTIPKGAQLIICSYSVHRNPKLWGPNVLKFDPDNFLPEKISQRHPYSYIPFSGGPRNCIGIKYAWISMKLVLWHLLFKYRFHTSLRWEDLKLMLSVTLKLANRHMISIELRK